MDNLKKSALAFKDLLDKEYILTVGKKGKDTTFKIIFMEEDFKHLTGLHKLKDLDISSEKAKIIFRECLSGSIKESDLETSIYYEKINDRIENIQHLERYIDGNMIPYKWDNKRCVFKCDIQGDYLLKENAKTEITAFIFLKETVSLFSNKLKVEGIKKESGISFFRDSKDYSERQEKYTLIRSEKVD